MAKDRPKAERQTVVVMYAECSNGHILPADRRDQPCSICEALQKFEEELERLRGLIKKLQDEKKDRWDLPPDVYPMCGES